jgi:hypothetical protein
MWSAVRGGFLIQVMFNTVWLYMSNSKTSKICIEVTVLSFSTPTGVRRPLPSASYTPKTNKSSPNLAKKSKKKLLPKYPCQSRSGMSVAVDTAWQKKGFDSLTCMFIFCNPQDIALVVWRASIVVRNLYTKTLFLFRNTLWWKTVLTIVR